MLEVVGDAVCALLVELLQRVHPHLRGKLVLQELGVHEFSTGVSLDQQHGLDHVLMGEEPQGRSLLVDIPNDHALIIRPAHKRLPVLRDAQPPDPPIMPRERFLAISSADLPQSDGLIPRAGEDEVSFRVEVDVGDVVIVAVEGLEALIIVIDIP